MKTLTLCLVLVVILGLATSGFAALVQWQPCSSPDEDMTVSCTVHEVDVVPCREAARGKPCRIRRGRDATIRFDFTPDFSGDNLETRAFAPIGGAYVGFTGMNGNACESTTCPATAGTRQTYSYSLPIDRNYPPNIYEVKWKLWNAEKKGCCFRFQIRLA